METFLTVANTGIAITGVIFGRTDTGKPAVGNSFVLPSILFQLSKGLGKEML